jgi:hypothetical protein
VKKVREQRLGSRDAFFFNWSLRVPPEFQRPFQPDHAAMAALDLHRGQPAHTLAANLRRAFSGIVAGNVKEEGMRLIEQHGPFEIHGDPDIMLALDALLRAFVDQRRMKMVGEYRPATAWWPEPDGQAGLPLPAVVGKCTAQGGIGTRALADHGRKPSAATAFRKSPFARSPEGTAQFAAQAGARPSRSRCIRDCCRRSRTASRRTASSSPHDETAPSVVDVVIARATSASPQGKVAEHLLRPSARTALAGTCLLYATQRDRKRGWR